MKNAKSSIFKVRLLPEGKKSSPSLLYKRREIRKKVRLEPLPNPPRSHYSPSFLKRGRRGRFFQKYEEFTKNF